MLKNYDGHANEKCQVVSIYGTYVYPIYGSGYKTLFDEADMTFTDHELIACPTITILLRDPYERFKTSVHAYCKRHKKGIKAVNEKIKSGKLVDYTWLPQYVWLCHLNRHYRGPVHLKSFTEINDITQRDQQQQYMQADIEPIGNYVKVDKHLMRNINKTVDLTQIVKRYEALLF
tara:strand:- start:1012 stop:1536 length:525 start_codon:yes stop_codon:yes gene_type:complete